MADLTASFAARKEERLKQEAEKKEVERRVSVPGPSTSLKVSLCRSFPSKVVLFCADLNF